MAESNPIFGLAKLNVTAKLENFFKKYVYSGGFLANDISEKLFDYGEASQACYKVRYYVGKLLNTHLIINRFFFFF
jgi:hypothetical protein